VVRVQFALFVRPMLECLVHASRLCGKWNSIQLLFPYDWSGDLLLIGVRRILW
jgi:hypothetical protein